MFKTIKYLIEKIQRKNLLAQALFGIIIVYMVFISFTIGKTFFFKTVDLKLFVLLVFGLAIPLLIFLLLVNLLLPELKNLYETKDGKGKGFLSKEFWKRLYFIFVFYLLTGILMQFMVDKTVEWLTSLGEAEFGLSAIYANMLTPLLIFFVRKSGNKDLFRDVLYANLLFILFFMAIEIPIGGFTSLHSRLFVTLAGILFPTIVFTLLDICIQKEKIKEWFR
ncbi:hypothetical protein HYX13_02820 [Candidatus Woesearchaeota archaeon]|nr:hypothetical protein [Candidatus Woesearchaeota archaeon]